MRYSPGHKERTRQRILKQAGRLFRARGYDGVGIDEIMAAAKLTRGGFYGYFRSKSALFAEVMGERHGLERMMCERKGETRAELAEEALRIASGYLHPDHRQIVGRGCTVAALSADAARSGRNARRAFTRRVEELVFEFERSIPDAGPRDARALTALVLCVGGIVLSRALDDDALAAAMLDACRDAVASRLVP